MDGDARRRHRHSWEESMIFISSNCRLFMKVVESRLGYGML